MSDGSSVERVDCEKSGNFLLPFLFAIRFLLLFFVLVIAEKKEKKAPQAGRLDDRMRKKGFFCEGLYTLYLVFRKRLSGSAVL